MKKTKLLLLLFVCSLKLVAQDKEYFSLSDTVVKADAIKEFPIFFYDCTGHFLNDWDYKTVDSIITFMKRNENVWIELGVYSSFEGTTRSNRRNTADYGGTIKFMLMNRGGIRKYRVTVHGYGEENLKISKKEFRKVRKEKDTQKLEKILWINDRMELKIIKISEIREFYTFKKLIRIFIKTEETTNIPIIIT